METYSQETLLLQKGRDALAQIKAQEAAARLLAERMDLESALAEAEKGNDKKLQAWLETHDAIEMWADRSHPKLVPTIKQPASSSVPTLEHHEHTESIVEKEVPQETTAIADEVDDKSVAEIVVSPWDRMIEAICHRQGVDRASLDTPISELEPTREDLPKTDSLIVLPEGFAVKRARDEADKPVLKKLLWLSPALLVSTAAHVVAIVGMSVYVFSNLVSPKEPMAILSSPIETEMVSMETPVQMEVQESLDLETTEPVVAPSVPSLSADISSSVASDVSLPQSMIGDSPGEAVPTGGVMGDAASATKSMPTSLATAQFFGVNATGNTFCYVVDRSGSMRGAPFEQAKQEIVRSLSQMKPTQRFYIYFFSENVEGLKLDGRQEEKYPVYATPDNIQKAIVWMDRIKIEGGRHPGDVLEQAIAMDPDGIFLLFDGETSYDLVSRVKRNNLVKDLFGNEGPRVPIHSVCFHTEDPKAQQLMKSIAQLNSGTYRYIAKPPSANTTNKRR
jgi:hypothetical protein